MGMNFTRTGKARRARQRGKKQRATNSKRAPAPGLAVREMDERPMAWPGGEAFGSLLRASSLGFILLDSEGRVQTMNQVMADLVGEERAALPSAHWADLLFEDDRPEAEEKLRSLSRGRTRKAVLKSRYLNSLGIPVWRSTVLVSAPLGPSGKRGAAGLVSRIYEGKASRRKSVFHNQKLARAERMGSLGMIAGGLAHEFNNFLEVILGFASLVKLRLPPQEDVQEPVRMIEEAARRAADLASQLLELTRETADTLESSDPAQVVRRILKIIGHTFDRKIRIESRLEPGLPWVSCDPQRLERAILNLAINARDAMADGGILLVGASRRSIPAQGTDSCGAPSPGEYVQIAVEDNGTGMEPEVLRHIFDPLFTTKPEGEGTGLGLPMVRKTVESSGGFIEVESRPGEGSHFRLCLPVAASAGIVSGTKAPTLIRGHGTILVVDDEPMVRTSLEMGLKQLGYKVLAADNGTRACELFAAHPGQIDCVLLDMVMPDMSGLETYERLRQLDPEVRVLLSSGYSRSSLNEDISTAEFLGKPYTLESLSAAIRRIREA